MFDPLQVKCLCLTKIHSGKVISYQLACFLVAWFAEYKPFDICAQFVYLFILFHSCFTYYIPRPFLSILWSIQPLDDFSHLAKVRLINWTAYSKNADRVSEQKSPLKLVTKSVSESPSSSMPFFS